MNGSPQVRYSTSDATCHQPYEHLDTHPCLPAPSPCVDWTQLGHEGEHHRQGASHPQACQCTQGHQLVQAGSSGRQGTEEGIQEQGQEEGAATAWSKKPFGQRQTRCGQCMTMNLEGHCIQALQYWDELRGYVYGTECCSKFVSTVLQSFRDTVDVPCGRSYSYTWCTWSHIRHSGQACQHIKNAPTMHMRRRRRALRNGGVVIPDAHHDML